MQLDTGLTLLLGGARSGKSDLAVQLGEAFAGQVTFVATATAGDDDMADRISRHQHERPDSWDLLEAPHCQASDVTAVASDSLIIFDCATMLVSNLMFDGNSDDQVLAMVSALGQALAARTAPSLMISNEVGLGIHPETELGRQYRDLLGRCNRQLASVSEISLFVVAGKVLPLEDITIDWS